MIIKKFCISFLFTTTLLKALPQEYYQLNTRSIQYIPTQIPLTPMHLDVTTNYQIQSCRPSCIVQSFDNCIDSLRRCGKSVNTSCYCIGYFITCGYIKTIVEHEQIYE